VSARALVAGLRSSPVRSPPSLAEPGLRPRVAKPPVWCGRAGSMSRTFGSSQVRWGIR